MKKQWWKESVVYQIYPRSFMDSDGDGIGDIKGIIQKLDYLKELGVDVLWISPIYASPGDDNGYDISDYKAILTEFGTMEDFDCMLQEAHNRNIKIMMDLVVNHTSDEHDWFVESRKSKDNPYRDYYIWRKGIDGKEPNNWGACFGGSAWEYHADTEMYYLHCFSKKQPDLNWENEKVREEVFDMMNWWCDKGIDGFRMDVISMISKDQRFPDGIVKGGLYGDGSPYFMNGPRVHEYLKEMNKQVLSKHDLITVGEAAGVTIEEAKKYAGEDSHELNMVFQFEHVSIGDGEFGKWTTEKFSLLDFKLIMTKWQTQLVNQAWNSLFLCNHDQPRSVSRFGDDRPEFREVSAKMLATCIHMMQGTPYIYQGEELAMTNAYFENIDQYKDIESLNIYQELTQAGLISKEEMLSCIQARGRDNARTPMQWDDSMNGGFTTGTPWIEMNNNYVYINAKEQLRREDSVFHYYQQLIRFRKEYPIVVQGTYELLLAEHEQVYAYKRLLEEEQLLVMLNFSETKQVIEIPLEFQKQEIICLIGNYKDTMNEKWENRISEIELRPYEAVVLYKK